MRHSLRLGITGHRVGTNQNSGPGFGRTGIRFIVKLFKMKPNYLFEIGKPVYQTTERLNQPLKIEKTNCKSEERAAESSRQHPKRDRVLAARNITTDQLAAGDHFRFRLPCAIVFLDERLALDGFDPLDLVAARA